MTERSQGFQNVSSSITWAAPVSKTLRFAKTLGCCFVAAAAMIAVSAHATMSTKKDAGAAKAPASAADAKGESSKKKDAMKDVEGAARQESKVAPADGAKKAAK